MNYLEKLTNKRQNLLPSRDIKVIILGRSKLSKRNILVILHKVTHTTERPGIWKIFGKKQAATGQRYEAICLRTSFKKGWIGKDTKSWCYQANSTVLELRLQLAQNTSSGHHFLVSIPPDFVEEYTLPQESTFCFSHIQPELLSFVIFATID